VSQLWLNIPFAQHEVIAKN